jgi:hypothetical protein
MFERRNGQLGKIGIKKLNFFVKFLFSIFVPLNPAGLDPQIFRGMPQIGCETTIAQKNLEKKITEKFLIFLLEIFFGEIFLPIFLQTFSIKTRSVA